MKKNVAIFIFDDVEVLDFAGPFEVFAVADELTGYSVFSVFTFAQIPGTVRARNGLKIVPDYTVENCPAPDILIVPGGAGTRPLLIKSALLEWMRVKARTAEVVASICTGALVLAKAGLLSGLEVTTHRDQLEMLSALAPDAKVRADVRFTDNGRICTAAGIAAGLDLSLHLVGRLLGAESAARTARYMEYPLPSHHEL